MAINIYAYDTGNQFRAVVRKVPGSDVPEPYRNRFMASTACGFLSQYNGLVRHYGEDKVVTIDGAPEDHPTETKQITCKKTRKGLGLPVLEDIAETG
tara:strand:- start:190 stop:480 length:291 start_codon:yes stop_codon:yes gene_type:complete